MALNEEDFICICDAEFDSIEQLQEHWRTNTTQTTGRPHYRLVKFVSDYGNKPSSKAETKPEEPQ